MSPRDANWLDEREQRAWRGFLRMSAAVDQALARQMLANSRLSLADYAVLVCLSESADGARRSFEIAELLQWEASRLSHQLRRMAGRGLVEARGCPTDGRGRVTAITDAGRAALVSAAPCHVAEVRRVFIDRLDTAQLDALAAIADSVLDAESDG
ncbi:MAG: winged helix-turn-helix transcriptional regulator [Actinobacteria bacterium]|nr:winged helix-turn-helix transcriptional regulator [Actinomycetota bacterium]